MDTVFLLEGLCEKSDMRNFKFYFKTLIPRTEPKIAATWSRWTSNMPENVLGDYIPIITWKYSSGNSRHWATWVEGDKVGKICVLSGCRGTGTPMTYTPSWFTAEKNNWKLGLHLFIHNPGLYGSMLQKAESSILPPMRSHAEQPIKVSSLFGQAEASS